jgi:hypothetical protein
LNQGLRENIPRPQFIFLGEIVTFLLAVRVFIGC